MTIRDCVGKIILISWKNHKIQLSRPWELLWIVFSPVILCLVAVVMRSIIEVDMRVDSVYDPIDLDRSWTELMEALVERQRIATEYGKENNPFIPKLVLGWAPNDYNIFSETITQSLRKLQPLTAQKFKDCTQLRQDMRRKFLYAGVCFDEGTFETEYAFVEGFLAPTSTIQPFLNYTLLFPSELRIVNDSFISANWMTNYQDDQVANVQERLNRPYCGGYVGYVREGFIQLQKVISETFLAIVSRSKLPEIQLRRFPIIGRKQDPLMLYLDRGLALLFIVGYLFPCQLLVYQVVTEKNSQLRLFMINMNIGNTIHFISWYFKGVFYMLFTSLLITLLCKIHWRSDHGVLTETPWHVLLMILVSYSLAANALAMMVSAFFKHPLNAVHVLTVLWIVTYMPFFVLWNNPEQRLKVLRYMSYALPNCMLAKVVETLVERELIFHKKWYDSGFELIFFTEPISVTKSAWVFTVAALVYCIIGLCMDMWNATELANKRMKRPTRAGSVNDDFQNERAESFTYQGTTIGVNSTKIYEVEPSHRRFKLKIKKLCKRFGTREHAALNLFTWNVYENEVTILMGHNGSGKTTLLRILAGLLDPNRGSVMISTHDMETERMAASAELGVALNNDLLLFDLSVIDHIHFVCQVRGMHDKGEIVAQANFYMQAMKIAHLKSRKVGHLSDPERVLFSVCCAFLGDCSIVLIDDIHSDLDKPTQSLIWGLINEEKSRRTIILVTNSSTLAETMADRLAIMANGELKCTGTRTFLKNMYGHGYRLTCVKGKVCNVSRLYTMLSTYMPQLTIESDIGLKVTFVLENKYEDKFKSLLDELEQNMEELNIVSFRIRDTSMEEIFLRFGCEQNDQPGGGQIINNHSLIVEDYYAVLAGLKDKEKLTGCRLFLLQMRALLYKRWIVAQRSWTLRIVDAFVLAIALSCTFAAILMYGKSVKLQPLTFNLTVLQGIEAFAETLTQGSKDATGMHSYYTELLYWYDSHVDLLTKETDGKSQLLHNSDFAENVNFRFLFGATFSEKLVTAWFNNIPLHTGPYSLNAVHNAVARQIFDEEATMDVALWPLPFDTNINTYAHASLSLGSLLAINITFILSFVGPSISMFLVRERTSTLKKQQFLAGVRLHTFWLGCIIFDCALLLLLVLCVLICVAIYLHPHHDFLFYLLLAATLLLLGLAVMLSTYVVSELFGHALHVFVMLCLWNSIGIIIFNMVVTNDMQNLPDWFQLHIQYTSAEIIYKLFIINEYKLYCKDPDVNFLSTKVLKCESFPNCCIKYHYFMKEQGIPFEFTVILLHILLLILLLEGAEFFTVLAFGFCRRNIPEECRISGDSTPRQTLKDATAVDASVIKERHLVARMEPEDREEYSLIIQNLGKRHKKRYLIDRLDLRIGKTECVCLNGYNNSGKTTFLKLLLQETRATCGRIWVGGYSMARQRLQCYRRMGYCPQNDNLPGEFTPKELMYIQAQLQGNHCDVAREVIEALMRMMGLQSCSNLPLQFCTTGQWRRLHFALAILGSPAFICVDGAPSGIDPAGKRTVLTITSYMMARGSSFLYTSLLPLDSERLCRRMPVLYDGQLWAIGSDDQMSDNYRDGYQLEVRFKRKANPNVSLTRGTWMRIGQVPMSPHKKLSSFMDLKFPRARLHDEQSDSMIFHMPLDSTTFSEIFLSLRKDTFDLNIEEFFVTRNMIIGLHVYLFDRGSRRYTPTALKNSKK
ncbi:ATP-binding cassette sub-family A member 3 isoform X1 [Drosophila guanche]|uniref:Blast:ATP-binding cassette sub-family A member 3 n=1 Tax=Drosophila guanche TaxID=7266 RepID=A0A3B0JZC0_DROGU|nr:ATP-binding cassette sub-family A member 3 isoform X1 [Drosophila guanche]SPP78071.1 blast:ATP-binding cassette sub-family A member 3 [Drosophila guanche]